MVVTKKISQSGKSLILFFAPIVLIVLVGIVEELSGTTLDKLTSENGYAVFFVFGNILWGLGILFALMSFKSKEGHTKKAFAGLVLNLLALLAALGVFSDYL